MILRLPLLLQEHESVERSIKLPSDNNIRCFDAGVVVARANCQQNLRLDGAIRMLETALMLFVATAAKFLACRSVAK